MKVFPIILFCLSILACDTLFGTREPEPPPLSGSRSGWQQPTASDIVLGNLKNAFAERNIENYAQSFVDSTLSGRVFRFEPDVEVMGSQPGLFDAWSIADERQYLQQLFDPEALPPDSTSVLTFEKFQEPELWPDSATYVERYDLQIAHKLPSVPRRVVGRVLFRMGRDINGNWSIHYWRDSAGGSAETTLPTWSELKARGS